jgi:hypothetical protein
MFVYIIFYHPHYSRRPRRVRAAVRSPICVICEICG